MDQFFEGNSVLEVFLSKKSAETARGYRKEILEFQRFVNKPLSIVEIEDIEDFYAHQTVAESTALRKVASVKSYLSFLHKSGAISRNVGAGVNIKKTKEAELKTESRECIRDIIALCGSFRNTVMLKFMYETASPPSAIYDLTIGQFEELGDGVASVVLSVKGKRTRVVSITAQLYEDVKKIKRRSEYIFESRLGGAISQAQVWRICSEAGKKAGVDDFNPFRLRSSAIRHALEAGCGAENVMNWAGIRSVDYIIRYLPRNTSETICKVIAL